jgi:hypothetical protein
MKITLSINTGHSVDLNYSQTSNVFCDIGDDLALADFYAETAKHPSSQVRCIVATKECLPIHVLEKLANDPHIDVVRVVAQNSSALKEFSVELLIRMIARDLGIAFELADKLPLIHEESTREEIIAAIQKIEDPELQRKVSRYLLSLSN